MRRIAPVAGLVLLLTAALLAPAAQAGRPDPQHTRYRYFEDRSTTGSSPGLISFTLLYRENPRGEFTPRDAVAYHLQVGVTCNPGGPASFALGGNAFSKYAYFSQPLVNGRFAHRFENQFENPPTAPWKGDLHGRVLKRLKRAGRVKRTARIDGAFTVEDWDPFGLTGVQENCASSTTSYSATPCKLLMSPRSPNYARWKRWNVPVCHPNPW